MCHEPNSFAISNIDALHSVGEVDCSGETGNPMLIGANLRRLRKQRGLSRRQLAHFAHIERSTLRHLERGALIPSVGMLWKLARELHVPGTAFIEVATPIEATPAQARLPHEGWRVSDVRFGSNSDLDGQRTDVRFCPDSGSSLAY